MKYNDSVVPPLGLRIFTYFTYTIILFSFLNLALSWLLFSDYSGSYIESHPSSFDKIETGTTPHTTVVISLVVRSLFSIGWVASVFYLRHLIHHPPQNLFLYLLGYSIIGCAGYGILALQASLEWQVIIRYSQLALCITLLVVCVSPSFRRSIKSYATDASKNPKRNKRRAYRIRTTTA